MRILADDYNTAPNANTGNLNKAQIIQRIVDWRNLIVGQNMYLIICTWDALDGAFSDAAWAGNAFRYHQMFSDIYAALGNDPFVVYEPTNEPNSLGGNGFDTAAWDAWQTNMQSTILHFRETIGYKGVLIIDPLWWANSGPGGQGYNDARYTAIENYDAARTGMNSTHQIVFAKHDYASNYSSLTWSPTGWQTGTGGSQIKHLIFENEFGNYNGSPSTVSDTWSSQASSFFANRFATSQNYVGGQAFLWGPWFDANAINTTDNINTTTWGNTVRQNFLLNAPSPPPPTSGFTPGVDGGSVLGLSGSLTASTSLGAKVVRQEWNMNTVPDSAMDNVIGQHASRGMRVLMLAGLPGLNPPVPASAGQLANWANRYGPGGTFWQGRSDGHLAVQHIEFGNETAFNYQTAGGNTSAAYAQKARDYATCFKVARDAIAATGKPVGLLCQGHQPDGLGPQWVDNMYAAVPNLWQYVAGWVTHPYGPDYISKLNDLINRQAAKSAPATIPIDITEIGIATDNGPAMQPHNYNWPQSMTYTQVADTLLNSAGTLTGNTIVANIRNDSRIGQRIRHFIWFQNKDQQPSGTSQREHYFGFLKSDAATSKGVLTERGRMVLRMGGGVPAGFNKVVNAGTSYSSAISGVTSGQVLGLNDGLYNWGLFTPPAGVTIKGVNQNALVVGQAAISQTGVTLSNFSLHTQSQAPGSNVAVIYVTGINFLLSRMILDANYTPNIHGMLVGGSGCKILDSIVRNTRGSAACFQTNGHNLIHAIYWFNSTNGEISRCWLYDNGGYGLHFYSGVGGSAANTVVNQVVTDQSVCNLGNVVDSITGPVTVNRSIITRAGPWNQVSPGASVVNNSRSVNGYIGAGVSGTGNVTADTTFQDRDGRDYRVPTDSNFQFFPGPA